MLFWYLFLAAITLADAAFPLPTRSKSCIDHCKCKLSTLPSRLHIVDCDRPLVLNETTFEYINKPLITVLSIENVIINEIEEGALREFRNLDDVLIVNTKIGSIDAKAFNNVKRLKFAECGFEDSPDLASEKLEELTFGDCQLEEIPDLNGLLRLTFLNLSGNYIKNIEIDAFAQLFDLEELHLSNNEIFKIPPTIFINNQQLTSLYLDNNPLRSFALNTTEDLETLSLKNCELETFDERFTYKLSTLNELILSHNNIKSLSAKSFANMKELSVINLAYNKLQALPDDIFSSNPNLIKINLDGNNLKTLPNFHLKTKGTFGTYTFSCKYCKLQSLSRSVFQNMAGMISLELSHNLLTQVNGAFDNITSLKILDISHNNIPKFSPESFINNQNLEALIIAGNPLHVLDPIVFSYNHNLGEIDARNTSLTKLWSNTNYHLASLYKILLGDNQLTTLSIDDFQVTPALEAIDLSNNPLIFNDQLCTVIHYLNNTGVSPIEHSNNLFDVLHKTFGEDIDGFSAIKWKDFYQDKCSNDQDYLYDTSYDNDQDEDEDNDDDDDLYDDNYVDEYDADELLRKTVGPGPEREGNSSLARASYILSITSVFVLSALVVLTVAVTVTLCILRRNNNFNIHTADLPRLKIPIWNTTRGEKKHSGSVYRPLSEDLSGPKTPKLSRYEFRAAPIVHSTKP